jgi:hypothetical protein
MAATMALSFHVGRNLWRAGDVGPWQLSDSDTKKLNEQEDDIVSLGGKPAIYSIVVRGSILFVLYGEHPSAILATLNRNG